MIYLRLFSFNREKYFGMKKREVRIIVSGFGKKPTYATSNSAGADLYAANVSTIFLDPLERVLLPLGIRIELPEDAEAQIRPRSGLAIKNGVTVLNSPGTIDADYQGEVGVILINLSKERMMINRGDRVAQMVLNGEGGLFQGEFVEVDNFERESERGEGGFGHTGK